jgi:pyridoxamine 5'-phosphate oxidase
MVITIDFEKCVQFANDHPTCSIATVDGDQPRVRTFGLWFADKDGFYFSSGKTKSIYRQCTVNPKVELCFYAPPERPPEEGGAVDIGMMMRATGTVKFLDDTAIKQRLFEERPFLRSLAENVVIFHVHNGEAWFWTWEDNLREADIKRIPF